MHTCVKCGKLLPNLPMSMRFDNIECNDCFDANREIVRPVVKQVYNVAQKAYDGVYLPNFTPGGEKSMNTCLFANDIDPYACAVYRKHWDDGTLLEGSICDVTATDVLRRGVPDVICGGVPCQDVSVAGKREGLKEGNRTGLWFEMLRLISEIRPKYALIENVPGLLGGGLSRILCDFAEIGYDAVWETISASAFGAPHQRDRVFIVAYPECRGWDAGELQQGSIFGQPEEWDSYRASDRPVETRVGSYAYSFRRDTGRDTKRKHEHHISEIGQTAKDKQSRRKRFSPTEPLYATSTNPNHSRREKQRQRESGGEFLSASEQPSWWQVESKLRGIPDGLSTGLDSNRVNRLKCLGNAIVPQVAQYVGECIMRHNGGEFTFAELFSGLGGFRLGFEMASGGSGYD